MSEKTCFDCAFHQRCADPGPEPERPDRIITVPAKRTWWQILIGTGPVVSETVIPGAGGGQFWLLSRARWAAAKERYEGYVRCFRFPEVAEHPAARPCGEFTPQPKAKRNAE